MAYWTDLTHWTSPIIPIASAPRFPLFRATLTDILMDPYGFFVTADVVWQLWLKGRHAGGTEVGMERLDSITGCNFGLCSRSVWTICFSGYEADLPLPTPSFLFILNACFFSKTLAFTAQVAAFLAHHCKIRFENV